MRLCEVGTMCFPNRKLLGFLSLQHSEWNSFRSLQAARDGLDTGCAG